jgi:hypothetical protein
MKHTYSITLTLALLFTGPTPLHAKQLSYNTRSLSSGTNIHMLWKDMHGKKRSTAFTVPTYDLKEGAIQFQAYNPNTMKRYTFTEIKKYARTLEGGGNKISVKLNHNGVLYSIQSRSQQTLGQIQRQMDYRLDKIQKDYFLKNGLKTYRENGKEYVMPDHSRIAKEYVAKMRPIATSIKQANRGKSMRETLNYALNFVQAIPYNTLVSRVTSNGQGFATPYGILMNNQGDCDSKSVMYAAIIKNLYPSVDVAMVYVPKHAFLALSLPQKQNDWALRLGGKTYVLTEPAGPALVPVGAISPSSKKYLQGKNYNYEKINF